MNKDSDEKMKEIYLRNPIFLKKTADDYSKRIGTAYDFDFGGKEWKEDLKTAFDHKHITYAEYKTMESFADKNRIMLSQLDDIKDVRWFHLNKWIEHVFFGSEEITPDNIEFFKRELEYRKNEMDMDEYLIVWFAFDDIDMLKKQAADEAWNEISAEEKMQKAKGRSFLIFLLIIILAPLPFCLIVQDFLLGVMLWGLCSPVAIPLTFIIAALVSDPIAEKSVGLKEEEQSEDYKAMKAASRAGLIVGGISAGVGCFNELKKPGWTKDSRQV